MKRSSARTLLTSLCFATLPYSLPQQVFATPVATMTQIPAAPPIAAQAYILMDYASGQVLAEHHADQHLDPSTLTRLMSYYVVSQAIRAGKIAPLTAEERLGVPTTGTALPQNGELPRESGGKILEFAKIAGGERAFIQWMNRDAERLGLKNSHFTSLRDSAPQHYSSARDVALLARALLRDFPEQFNRTVQETRDNLKPTTHSELLLGESCLSAACLNSHQNDTGYNLLSSTNQSSMRLIVAILGGKAASQRGLESQRLVNWGFRYFESLTPLRAAEVFASEPIWFGRQEKARLGVAADVHLTVPRGRSKDIKASYSLNHGELHAPLFKNQIVGVITFQLDGQTLTQRPLVNLVAIPEGGLFSQAVDYLKLLFHRWFG